VTGRVHLDDLPAAVRARVVDLFDPSAPVVIELTDDEGWGRLADRLPPR
jgi:hypothetical protein